MKVFCKLELTAQQGNMLMIKVPKAFSWGLFVLEI